MKYVITERQLSILMEGEIEEIGTARGYYRADPMNDWLSYVINNLPNKKLIKVFKEYFGGEMGKDISSWDEDKIEKYFSSISNNNEKPLGSRNYYFYNAVTGLAYYIAQKYYKIKETEWGLNYVKIERSSKDYKEFYFFDPMMEIFVGKISVSRDRNFTAKVWKVSTSAAERKLIGMGYGLKMYFSILENVDYLLSDTILYSGSLRIWRDVLPKYCNTWWIDKEGEWNKFGPEEGKNIPIKDTLQFVASFYHETEI